MQSVHQKDQAMLQDWLTERETIKNDLLRARIQVGTVRGMYVAGYGVCGKCK